MYLDAIMSMPEEDPALATTPSSLAQRQLSGASSAARRSRSILAQPCLAAGDDDDSEDPPEDEVLPAAVVLGDTAAHSPSESARSMRPLRAAASMLRSLAHALSGDRTPTRQRSKLQTAIINGQSPADARAEAQRSGSIPARLTRVLSSTSSGLLSAASSLTSLLQLRRGGSQGSGGLQISAHRSTLQGKHAVARSGRAHTLLVQQDSSLGGSITMHSLDSSAPSRGRRSLLVQPSSASASADRAMSRERRPTFEQHAVDDTEHIEASMSSARVRNAGRRGHSILAVQRSTDSTNSITGRAASQHSGRDWLMQPGGHVQSAVGASNSGQKRRRGAIYVQRSSASSSELAVGPAGGETPAHLAMHSPHDDAAHLRGKAFGAGVPWRGRALLAVQHSTATDGSNIAATASTASSARRRGALLSVQRSSDSVVSADSTVQGSAARRRPQLLVQQSDVERVASLQHSRSSASAAGSLDFWGFASRLMGHQSQDIETSWSTSSASSRARGTWLVQSRSESVTTADRAASLGSQPSSINSRRSVTSVHSGRSAKRAVLIVQSSSPSTSGSTPHWLSRGQGAPGSRRPQLLQLARSTSNLSAESGALRSASSSIASSSASRRTSLLQVSQSDSIAPAGSAAAHVITAKAGSLRRQRMLVAKPGMGRSRRNYGCLVQTSSDSVLAASIRSEPPAMAMWMG